MGYLIKQAIDLIEERVKFAQNLVDMTDYQDGEEAIEYENEVADLKTALNYLKDYK